jgi:phosphoesterase RecJ-like protein
MVTFDCGSLDRLNELAEPAREAGELIVVDHHATNESYGTVNLLDADAAASAVMVYRLAKRLGWAFTRDVAICLYTGIVTDTGRFQYSNTSPEVLEMATELSRFDLPIAEMSRQLFEEHRFAYMQLVSVALQRAELDAGRRFVATWITADDLERFGVEMDEAEGLIDLVRRTAEADVSCVLKESPEGTKVSLRSVTDFDVAAIATSFGGGGHKAAAGFSDPRSIAEVLADIRAQIPIH